MYAMLIYGFPLTLLAFEWGLRTVLNVDTAGFTGPTLAAAGLSFLMPLVKPKLIDIPGQSKTYAISKRDVNFIPVLWIFVFIFLFSWCLSCYVSLKFPSDKTCGFSSHLVIGGALYALSLILTAIKEKL
jgi:hypothetical protein